MKYILGTLTQRIPEFIWDVMRYLCQLYIFNIILLFMIGPMLCRISNFLKTPLIKLLPVNALWAIFLVNNLKT